jgi:hypothetical protein
MRWRRARRTRFILHARKNRFDGASAMNRKLVLTVGAVLLFASAALALGWSVTYRPGDPKNFRYVMWKAGFVSMDLDRATDTMVEDSHRDELVVRKTRRQLEKKFGYLLAREQATAYLRECLQDSPWKDRDILFIRSSAWMVVFDGEKAAELVLIKGC